MLLDLKVLNGRLTPDFSSDLYSYIIEVEDVDQLELDLKVDKDLPVTIYGNDYLTEGENHVLIEIFDERVVTYTLIVYKKEEQMVAKVEDNTSKIEINAKNLILEDILTPGIITICFVIIVILYSVIFHKK